MKYVVNVHFTGNREYEIEAESPWDAEVKAMEEFSKDDCEKVMRYGLKDAFPTKTKIAD